MYISKVIFLEYDEIGDLEDKYGTSIVSHTDYGTTEIVGSQIQDTLNSLTKEECEYNFTKKELMEDLNNTLGTDVVDMLLHDELDFILVV